MFFLFIFNHYTWKIIEIKEKNKSFAHFFLATSVLLFLLSRHTNSLLPLMVDLLVSVMVVVAVAGKIVMLLSLVLLFILLSHLSALPGLWKSKAMQQLILIGNTLSFYHLTQHPPTIPPDVSFSIPLYLLDARLT